MASCYRTVFGRNIKFFKKLYERRINIFEISSLSGILLNEINETDLEGNEDSLYSEYREELLNYDGTL